MRVLQIGREMVRTSSRYSMPSMLMFVLPTLFDSHPATVEQLSKERRKVASSPLPRRLPFDRLHRSVVPADPTDEEDVESVGRQMPLHLRRKQAASERASERQL